MNQLNKIKKKKAFLFIRSLLIYARTIIEVQGLLLGYVRSDRQTPMAFQGHKIGLLLQITMCKKPPLSPKECQ